MLINNMNLRKRSVPQDQSLDLIILPDLLATRDDFNSQFYLQTSDGRTRTFNH